MTTPRDPAADDAFLDRLLDEEVGGRTAPDLAAKLAQADAATMARAAERVDAAAASAAVSPLPAAPARRTLVLVLAAAALLLGVAAAWTWLARGDAPRAPTVAERGAALLDAFHRVMPVEPPALRDAARRQRIAPEALPVLRELIAYLTTNGALVPWHERAAEFTIYALVLADPEVGARLDAETRAGDPAAQVQVAAAAAITAASERERAQALRQVATHLREPSTEARCAVFCLLTMAELSADEALGLAAASQDDKLVQQLRVGAELAQNDPRRLLNEPFELVGRLHTGASFSTASLRGKVVLVFFWASWCKPCTVVLPEIVAAAKRYESQGLAVVGVSCDHDRDELAAFLAEHPEVTWPQLYEPGQPGWHQLAFWSGVRAVPRTFLVDRRGILREIHTRGDLDRLITKLLTE